MSTDPTDAVAGAQADLRLWRAAHPNATFAEMEAAVEERLGAVRAALLADAGGGVPAAAFGPCPTCGTPLRPRGHKTRTLRIPGGVQVPLNRPYAMCPHCGQGLFPPR